MFDIHHHLLFGLDDGSKDIETSVAMAEMASADGITHIVCTPHANFQYPFDPAVNLEKLEALRARLEDKITLGLGCDFHLSFDNIDDAKKNPAKYAINGHKYLLVEFADMLIPPQLTQVLYEFVVSGIIPIITHPERNPTIVKTPQRLDEWIHGGCLVQVTASSLTGRFGRPALSFAQQLLGENKVHFLATDAHNLTSRPPVLTDAFNIVAEKYGQETAHRLCVANPKAVFYGETLPPQPAYFQADDHATEKPGLWSRLLGKTR
jgi:protein-tyrosine phosphatase